ncbi:hypothetical protein EAE96_004632 [Botrytis aclada]|nr:hypothetical protein EAE96_004632 [Botrytis aclada]
MAAMSLLKRDPMGMYDLGSDGILRSFSGPYKHDVIDGIGLSPRQIKELLDLKPWSQEKEDRFRGVDGRIVATDRRRIFEPKGEDRKEDDTEESLERKRVWAEGKNRELRERMERERREGVDVEAKYACTRAVSDYDLSPRDTE